MDRTLPVQPGGVDPDGLYLLGHYHGLYSGPCGHLEMVNGVPDCGPVEGCLITHGGLENLCEVFEYAEGRRLEWDGEAWQCVEAKAEPDSSHVSAVFSVDPPVGAPLTQERTERRRRRRGRR